MLSTHFSSARIALIQTRPTRSLIILDGRNANIKGLVNVVFIKCYKDVRDGKKRLLIAKTRYRLQKVPAYAC